ncbi:MAG: hypothetical protein ACRDQZ_10400 [Mycobacteriales bacterium]
MKKLLKQIIVALVAFAAVSARAQTSVSLAPSLSSVTPSQSESFTATPTGSAALTWSVDGVTDGDATTGTITSTGASTATYSPTGSTTIGNHLVRAQPAGGSLSSAATVSVSDIDGVFTGHNDISRTGANTKEYALTPSTVNSSTFGKLFSCALDSPGYVYAQPLYVANITMADTQKHNVVYVATESNWVYAYDADTNPCHLMWKTRVMNGGETTVPASDVGTSDLTPEIGVTATPVIDAGAGLIYVTSKSKSGSTYFNRLHALDLTTGAESLGGPVLMTSTNFTQLRQFDRPALLLDNGTVYVGFGSHGDICTYQGWLMGYDATDLSQQFAWSSTDATDCNQGAIWQSGAGPAADSSHNVYVETGNGTWASGTQYSDSVVKLDSGGSVVDWFTPYDQASLSASDTDLGSGGPVLLPDSVGSGGHPHLMTATAKTGILYLIDRDDLTHFHSGGPDQIVQEVTVKSGGFGFLGQPSYWNGALYTIATSDALKRYTIASAVISGPVSQSGDTFGGRGGFPVISANGNTNGVVWALNVSGYSGSPVVLNAYSASNVGTKLYGSPTSGSGAAGNSTKFSSPTVANGKVYVGSQGRLDVFGLLGSGSPVSPPTAPPPPPTITGHSVTLTWIASTGATSYNVKRGTTPGGPYATIGNSTGLIYVDGSSAVQVGGTTFCYVVTALGPGGESANSNEVCATIPLTGQRRIGWKVHRDGANMVYDTLTIDGAQHFVNMSLPSGPTGFSDAIGFQFRMDEGPSGTSLSEALQNADLQASVNTPNSKSITFLVTNNGSLPATFTSIDFSPPNADYSETDDCPSILTAGASCHITVTFTPHAPGQSSTNLRLIDDAPGSPQLVPLTGNGSTAPPPPTGSRGVGMIGVWKIEH